VLRGNLLQTMCHLYGCTSIHQKQSNAINLTFNLAFQIRSANGRSLSGVNEKSTVLLNFRAVVAPIFAIAECCFIFSTRVQSRS
jgi:hypothetical protein